MTNETEGNKVVVSVYNDLVVLHLDKPEEYLPFNAVGAVDIGTRLLALAVEADKQTGQLVINASQFLADHVYEVREDLKPVGGALKHEIIERHRMTLTQRLSVILNSTREDKRISNGQLAKSLVDTALSEIF